MKNSSIYTAAKAVILFAFVLVLTNSSLAQSETKKDSIVSASPTAQTVNAQQAGPWTVGIDAAKNALHISNSAAEAVPVQVVSGAAPQPFHTKIPISLFGGGPSSSSETSIDVPAGKRLVVEALSAIAEVPAGERASMYIVSYADGTPGSWAAHYLSLADQGTFGTKTLLTANHKTTAYAVGRIMLNARATWTGPSTAALVTIVGYLEDLPAAP